MLGSPLRGARTVPRRARSVRAAGPASSGFVITAEFLLIVALVVLPLLLGTFLLGRKLFTLMLGKRPAVDLPYAKGVVWDSTPGGAKSMGPVIDFDQFKAPRIIFRDDGNKLGVLLGARTNRFTTVSKVYYSGLNCTGTAYVRTAASLIDEVGVLYHLQGINYAMGKDNILYKEGAAPPASVTFQSVWTSQDNGNPNSPPGTVPIAPDPGPVTACENVTNTVTIALLGLSSITCAVVGGNATFTATTVQTIPAPIGPLPGAIVTYNSNNQNACEWIPHALLYFPFPTIFNDCDNGGGSTGGDIDVPQSWTVNITGTNTFTYIFNGPVLDPTNGGGTYPGQAPPGSCPNGAFPNGQLANTGLSGSLTTGSSAPFALATPVIDLDASGNYTRPYRLSFPTPTAGPALPCPNGECGAPVPGPFCPNGECP